MIDVGTYDVCGHFREHCDSTQSTRINLIVALVFFPSTFGEEGLSDYIPSSFHMLYVYRAPLQDRHEGGNGAVCHVYICQNKPFLGSGF